MSYIATSDDVFGLARPVIDAHTLGLSSVSQLLEDCGLRTVTADAVVCAAVGQLKDFNSIQIIEQWLRQNRITRLGFSYRLDPKDGAFIFGRLLFQLRSRKLFAEQGGPLRYVYFAGLPSACEMVRHEHRKQVEVFYGDETPGETLDKLGVPRSLRPSEVIEQVMYDSSRLEFGRELIKTEQYLQIEPVDRTGYPGFGTAHDLLVNRIRHSIAGDLPPLMRAHVGPYLPNRAEAVNLFLEWCRQLAETGLLDILSIGTSQLSQSNFGEEWGDKPNGGGVPINSPIELRAVWESARPMLVRTYAGTTQMTQLARMYEKTINIAWHTFSLWWFCAIDGRGPLSVRENLKNHLDTLKFVAESGKPYEPNIAHHFAFRGADDVTYVVSAVLAARLAKRMGVRYLVLQNMLNTPKYTWGVQDLAKSRALLRLVRELEDESFKVFLQPRAGLDLFSADQEKARAQLAAVTALMDDIEPNNPKSPEIIHVVSYSEASHLADPQVVNESIRIVRSALTAYRRQRTRGNIEDMSQNHEVISRTEELLNDARIVLDTIERHISEPYSARGLYDIFASSFLTIPYLWECKDEFSRAAQWRTKLIKGSVKVVDKDGRPLLAKERMQRVVEWLQEES